MTKKFTIVTALFIVAVLQTGVFAQSTATRSNATQNAPEEKSAFTVIKPVAGEMQNAGEVTRLLQSGGNLDDAGTATINNYLQRYYFARWTDPKNAGELTKYQREMQTFVDGISNQQGKEFLLSRLSYYLYGFASKKDFYPGCRYNAIIALGELDSGQTNGRPVPYLRALALLLRAYNNKGDDDDMANEAVRLGALLGIRRHVILGITNVAARDEQVAKLLMSIAADTPYKKDELEDSEKTGPNNVIVLAAQSNAEKTSEPQRTVDQHNWFRNRAINTLGYLSGASKATQDAIIDTLLARIEDELETPSIRYQSAYSLSQFNKTIMESPDLMKRTTNSLLVLGLVVYEDGIQTMMAERSTQQTVGSMSGSMGTGGSGMSSPMSGSSSGMSSDSMISGGTAMGQVQADQINNSLIQIKDGLSSMIACIQGPDLRSGGLANTDAVKDSPYHEVLLGLNKSIADCVKFLDEGDPEAAKKAKELAERMAASSMMDSSSSSSSSGMTPTVTVKNQPKVTMKEIDERLKIFRGEIENLQNIMARLEAGTTLASQ